MDKFRLPVLARYRSFFHFSVSQPSLNTPVLSNSPPQLEPQKKHKAKPPTKVRPSLPPSKSLASSFSDFFVVVIQTKMMSIFSSFDALCAESRGQKVTFSFSPAKAQPPPKDSPAPAAAEKAKSVAGGKPLPPAPKQPQPQPQPQPQQKKRAPRFAPELDGVHCFETILPY